MDLERRNVTEKIIFCIDLDSEADSLDFARAGKKQPTRLDLVKSGVRLFVHTKKKMNPNHEYAICVITDGAIWYQDLTTDTDQFCKKLMGLQTQGYFQSFNMTSLFELINKKFPHLIENGTNKSSTEEVFRVIFFYSRSNTIPTFQATSTIHQQLLDVPIFFWDALYLHSKPSKDIKPQEVYDFITDIEGKEHTSYFFENSTSVRKFHLHIAKLLAHPLQRPEQTMLDSPSNE